MITNKILMRELNIFHNAHTIANIIIKENRIVNFFWNFNFNLHKFHFNRFFLFNSIQFNKLIYNGYNNEYLN